MMDRIINLCTRRKKEIDDDFHKDDKHEDPEEEAKEFNQFHETYKKISFALSCSMMYPNLNTTKFRKLCILLILGSVLPMSIIFMIDMYKCWKNGDFVEIIRHSTVIGPFIGGFSKMFMVLWAEKSGVALIEEINRDYSLYNHASEEYKAIVRKSITNCLINTEGWWAVNVLSCVMIFPLMATVLNLHSFIFKQGSEKFMIHELNNPFAEQPEDRSNSPYFEIMYAYMFYCACLYTFNFIGYDGFFGLAINHACLKMTMYCKALEHAMRSPKEEIRQRVVWVIHEQNRTFEYIGDVQDFFNVWLGVIFIATLIQISNMMIYLSQGYGFDLRYMIFLTGATVHIFLPCHYAAKMKMMCAEVSTKFYCCGWESVDDQSLRKMLCFMIARAQIPLTVTAFNMITFDMELFVSILQSSYSMYTLFVG